MLRPSILSKLALVVLAAATFSGCRTIYSDMYSPKRSRFVPDKVQPKQTEILPEVTTTTTTTTQPDMGFGAPPPAVPPGDGGLLPPPAPAPDAGLPPADPAMMAPPQ